MKLTIYKVGIYVLGLALTTTVVFMIIPIQKDMDAWPK